jgi:hypothetical protein
MKRSSAVDVALEYLDFSEPDPSSSVDTALVSDNSRERWLLIGASAVEKAALCEGCLFGHERVEKTRLATFLRLFIVSHES